MTTTENLYCTFRLAGRLFGVDVRHVKEVNTEKNFTPVPHAPSEVWGFANLRGQIHLVLDLRTLLGLEKAAVGADNHLVIFKPTVGESFGVLVDAIGDIVAVEESQIEAQRSPAEVGNGGATDIHQGGDLIVGVGKRKEGLLIILDVRKFLPLVERGVSEI